MIAAPTLPTLTPGRHHGIVAGALRHACATAVHGIATLESARQPGVAMPLIAWLQEEARAGDACLDPESLAALFRAIARWQMSLVKRRATGPAKAATLELATRAEQAWTWTYALAVATHGGAADRIASGVLDDPAAVRRTV